MNTTEELLQEIHQLLRQRRHRELGALLSRVVREQPAAVGNARIRFANLLALGADWEAVRALLPTETNTLETSGWLNSLAQGKPVDRNGDPVPWFTYPAIDFLTQIIKPTWRVFEWGSGYSTLWWANRVQTVTSVEDNRDWFETIQPRMPANASLLWRADESAYVGALSEQGGCFDLIVIDGSHRNACARVATAQAARAELIVFDNADVETHRDGVELLKKTGWKRIDFYGLIPSYCYKNCTSLFFRDPTVIEPATWPGGVASCVGPTCDQALRATARMGAKSPAANAVPSEPRPS